MVKDYAELGELEIVEENDSEIMSCEFHTGTEGFSNMVESKTYNDIIKDMSRIFKVSEEQAKEYMNSIEYSIFKSLISNNPTQPDSPHRSILTRRIGVLICVNYQLMKEHDKIDEEKQKENMLKEWGVIGRPTRDKIGKKIYEIFGL